MFKKVNTVQYPEEREGTQPAFHGRHQLNRYDDGLENMYWLRIMCVGLSGRCNLCKRRR